MTAVTARRLAAQLTAEKTDRKMSTMPTSWEFTSPAVRVVTTKPAKTTSVEASGKRRRHRSGAASRTMSPYSSGRDRSSSAET